MLLNSLYSTASAKSSTSSGTICLITVHAFWPPLKSSSRIWLTELASSSLHSTWELSCWPSCWDCCYPRIWASWSFCPSLGRWSPTSSTHSPIFRSGARSSRKSAGSWSNEYFICLSIFLIYLTAFAQRALKFIPSDSLASTMINWIKVLKSCNKKVEIDRNYMFIGNIIYQLFQSDDKPRSIGARLEVRHQPWTC